MYPPDAPSHSVFPPPRTRRPANSQRGSDDTGGAIGIGLLVLLILVVAYITGTPAWLAGNVRTTYTQCMAAAQTPADQKLCDPTSATPSPR